jgi:hypothetical protein
MPTERLSQVSISFQVSQIVKLDILLKIILFVILSHVRTQHSGDVRLCKVSYPCNRM